MIMIRLSCLVVLLVCIVHGKDAPAPTCANKDDSSCIPKSDVFGLDDSWCVDVDPTLCEHDYDYSYNCVMNQAFALKNCRKSCHILCGPTKADALEWLGVGETMDPSSPLLEPQVDSELARPNVVNETVEYMRTVLMDPSLDPVKFQCKDTHKDCMHWTSEGNCDNEFEQWMTEHCPVSCQKCDLLTEKQQRGQLDFKELVDPQFWRDLAKQVGADLTISDNNKESKKKTKLAPIPQNAERSKTFRDKMVHDGYIQLTDWTEGALTDGGDERLEQLTQDMSKIVTEVSDVRKFLPQLLLVYDETWEVVNALSKALEELFGLKLAHDFYVFNVKPGASGTEMHRDRQGEDWKIQFQTQEPYEGIPVYTTVWFGLTEATARTSSMFILPAYADRDYRRWSDDPENFVEEDDVNEQVMVDSYRHVRPLPAMPGTAFAWSQRALHWSSAPPPDAPHSRQTLTFAMTTEDTEPPMLKHVDTSSPPPFEARIAVILYCAISYHFNFYALSKDSLLQALTILSDPTFADHLSDEALSPLSDRTLGEQFLTTIKAYWHTRELRPLLKESIIRLARYVVEDRGLHGSDFFQELVRTYAEDGDYDDEYWYEEEEYEDDDEEEIAVPQ